MHCGLDSTDTDEGFTVEMLSSTEVLEYEKLSERIYALRAKIKAIGIKATARASGVSCSQIQAIVNEGKIPHESTIARLESVLEKR